MSRYTETTWVDDVPGGAAGTTFTASRMNNIEDGITDVAKNLLLRQVRLAACDLTSGLPAHTRSGSVLTASANGALSVDGVTPSVGDRILYGSNGSIVDSNGPLGSYGTHLEHGIYTVTQVGAVGAPWILTRAADMNTTADLLPGIEVNVSEGTLFAEAKFLLVTNATMTLNTTALGFARVFPRGDDPSPTGGRLTLSASDPCPAGDLSGATTLYYLPALHNKIALPSDGGGGWVARSIGSGISLALGTLTSDKNYDVFIHDVAGTPTLSLTAWTSDLLRATALARLDGALVLSTDTAKRYIGTIRTTSTTATEDSAGKRFVWNLYNRKARVLKRATATDSWTYAVAAFRQWNAAAAERVEVVTGVADEPTRLKARLNHVTSNGAVCYCGIGLDSTTVNSADIMRVGQNAVATYNTPEADFEQVLPVGYHALNLLEYGAATGTQTFFGDAGDPPRWQSGALGAVIA